MIRTSVTDPLHIDWLSRVTQGRVGLTFAPGKHSVSRYTANTVWQRDLELDLAKLRTDGVTDLVCLLEDRDLNDLKIPGLVERARAHGLRVHRLPIADQSVPSDHNAVIELIAELRELLSIGASIVIHCEGGKGRTGVIAGCLLVSLGHTASDALEQLREARGPHCPETERQREYIVRFAT